jgi:NitT/TauT family transport system substrate-binding protein
VNSKYLGDRALNCKMVKATTRAWLAAGKDPDGAVEALHQLFPQTNKGAKDLTKQQWLDSFELLTTKATKGKPAGLMAAEDWDGLLKLLTEYGGMEKALATADYYTNDFFDCR